MWPDDADSFIDVLSWPDVDYKFYVLPAIDGSEIVVDITAIKLVHKYPCDESETEDYDE